MRASCMLTCTGPRVRLQFTMPLPVAPGLQHRLSRPPRAVGRHRVQSGLAQLTSVMGVYMLTAALGELKKIGRMPAESIDRSNPPLLLVDGQSWYIGMIKHTHKVGFGANNSSPRLDILGGLDSVHELATSAIREWREKGFEEIIVFLDGPRRTVFKDATKARRDQQACREADFHRLVCRGEVYGTSEAEYTAVEARDHKGSQLKLDQEHLRFNDLCREQFTHVLLNEMDAHEVKLVVSPVENDFYIPHFAAHPPPEFKDHTTYIASGDSDFAFVKDCRWIPLNEGKIDFVEPAVAGSNPHTQVRAWNRDAICTQIGLKDPRLLAAVAMLSGNDHTKELLNAARKEKRLPREWFQEWVDWKLELTPLERFKHIAKYLQDLQDEAAVRLHATTTGTDMLEEVYTLVADKLGKSCNLPDAHEAVDFNEVVHFNRAATEAEDMLQYAQHFVPPPDARILPIVVAKKSADDMADSFIVHGKCRTPGAMDTIKEGLHRAIESLERAPETANVTARQFILDKLEMLLKMKVLPFASDYDIALKALRTPPPAIADRPSPLDVLPCHNDTLIARVYVKLCKAFLVMHHDLQQTATGEFVDREQHRERPEPLKLFCATTFHNTCVQLWKERGEHHVSLPNAFGLRTPPELSTFNASQLDPKRLSGPPPSRDSSCLKSTTKKMQPPTSSARRTGGSQKQQNGLPGAKPDEFTTMSKLKCLSILNKKGVGHTGITDVEKLREMARDAMSASSKP